MHFDVFVIDVLSAPLLPLAALLYLLTIFSTLKTKAQRFSLRGTLFSESLLLATLSCRNGWLLIFLLSIGLLQVWFELKIRRRQATRMFLIHMFLFIGCLTVSYALLPADASEHLDSPST